jgi:hypothetical protein
MNTVSGKLYLYIQQAPTICAGPVANKKVSVIAATAPAPKLWMGYHTTVTILPEVKIDLQAKKD